MSRFQGIPVENNGGKFGGIPVEQKQTDAQIFQQLQESLNPNAGMQNGQIPREQGYEYGNILPYRKNIKTGKIEWSPEYSNLVKSVVDAVTSPYRSITGKLDDPVKEALGVAALAVPGMVRKGKVVPESGVTGGIKQTPTRTLIRSTLHPVKSMKRMLAASKDDRKAIIDALATKTPDERAAGYVMFKPGAPVKDNRLTALIREAERQGFNKGQLTAVQMASNADKNAMQRMIAIKKNMARIGNYQKRPSDVAGEVVIKQLNSVKNIKDTAGKQLDAIANQLKGKKVDFTPAVDDFVHDLDKIGVTFDRQMNPVFKGSDIQGIKPAENAIRAIVNRMKLGARREVPDAYDMHRLKRYIDENVNYGKMKGGLTGKTESIIKNLRHNIDSSLDNASPAYDQVNTRYSDAIGAINDIQDISRSMDFSGEYANSNMGQLMRRMMSNAVSRERVSAAVDQLHQIYTKYGGVSKNDPRVLMGFANELDSVFGSSAPTSFMGEISKGVKHGLSDAAMGGRSGAIKTGAAALQAARGINEDNAFKAIDNLLQYRGYMPKEIVTQ